jgi:hypothetical protein
MLDDGKRAVYRALEDRVVRGAGTASAALRSDAFANEGLAAPVSVLIGKVADQPAAVTQADLQAVTAAGLSEDEVFELVVCAAVGRSARMYDRGLAALAEAIGEGGHDAS